MINLGTNTVQAIYLGNNVVSAIQLGTSASYFATLDASGGTTGSFTSGSFTYKYHKFTTNGTFSVLSGVTSDLQILVVGGGAGGGYRVGTTYAKGGGAGGVNYYFTTSSISSGSYSVVIGNGGQGPYVTGGSDVAPTNGSQSSFGTLLYASGGFTDVDLNDGSSGAPTTHTAGTNFVSAGTGGGGGGADVNGTNATNSAAGTGGNGLQYNIDGTNSYYAGGGGGSSTSFANVIPGANGGLGGGGKGGDRTNIQQNATANTGGGGGAQGFTKAGSPAGNGGSGIVIVTYKSGLA
jgi:hypothetical protein